jgi:hypothetical protein
MISDYDLRSLQHERHMLDLYRRGSGSDAGLLQPLANACWRASAFEWRLYEDEAATRTLWEEGARALGDGFVRRRSGFERSPDQLLLAVHLSIAAQDFKLVETMTHITFSIGSRLKQRTRSQTLLLEGYLALARAVFEGRKDQAVTARRLLDDHRAELDQDGWKQQFESDRDAQWKMNEHQLLCSLLRVIAELMTPTEGSLHDIDFSIEAKFWALMDKALAQLDEYLDGETDHRPKLYFWLPGIAVTVLAEASGLSLDWLHDRQEAKNEHYKRLPLKLIAA